MQYCDDVIMKYFPKLVDKSRGIFVNAVVITSDMVTLVKSDTTTWTMTMDRQEVSLCLPRHQSADTVLEAHNYVCPQKCTQKRSACRNNVVSPSHIPSK